MDKMLFLLMLCGILHPFFASSQGIRSCDCVPGGSCDNVPYGSLALDISVLGLFPPCSNHGYVRCCSRDGLEQLYAGMLKAVITQPRVQVKPVGLPGSMNSFDHNHSDDECGCIPKGICSPGDTRETSECNGHLELCCIHDLAHSDILVNIFSQDEVFETTPPTPVFRPSPVFSTDADQSEEDLSPLDFEGLPCLSALQCDKVYGYDPLDIAKFGVLAPCSKRGFHRCVEPKASVARTLSQSVPRRRTTARTTTTRRTTSTTTVRTTTTTATNLGSNPALDPKVPANSVLQKMRLVPCIPSNLCKGSLYNTGNGGHLARFGVLPRCHFGMVRCIMEVDISIDTPQPRIRLPFFTSEVMEANFDLPVFTVDNFRAQMHRFFDGKLHGHDKEDQSTDLIIDDVFNTPRPRTTTYRPPPPATAQPLIIPTTLAPPQQPVDINQNLRLFLSQLQQKSARNNPKIPAAANQVTSQKSGDFEAPQGAELLSSSDNRNYNRDSALRNLQKIAKNLQLGAAKPSSEPPVKSEGQPKVPSGSRRIVPLAQEATAIQKPTNAPVNQGESKSKLRNFFAKRRRPLLFNRSGNEKKKEEPSSAPNAAEFPNFEVEAAISEDRDGNLVISGGRKVFALPPGIVPPPGAAAPTPPVSSPDRSRANKGGGSQKPPVFFDPSDAPQVAEVLKNSKSSVIQVHTDDNQKMVLNVKNDQLLGILQALHTALDSLS